MKFHEMCVFEVVYSKDEINVKKKPWKTMAASSFVGDITLHGNKISARVVAENIGDAISVSRDTFKSMQSILNEFYQEKQP